MHDNDIKPLVFFGIVGAVTIIGPALAIAYVQKDPSEKDKERNSLGYAAFSFQVLISILLLFTLVFSSYTIGSDKTTRLPKHFNLSLVLGSIISIIIILCMIAGNILFYVSYFDKNKKDDKQFDNLTTGFQSTIFVYVGAILLAMITIPCLVSSHPAACI